MQQTWWTPQPQLAGNQLWADIYVICSLFSATCLLVFSVTMHHHLWLMEMDVFEAAHLRLRVWLWDHGVEILIFVFLGIVQVQNVNLEAGFCFTSLHFRVVSCSLWVFHVQSINEEMLQSSEEPGYECSLTTQILCIWLELKMILLIETVRLCSVFRFFCFHICESEPFGFLYFSL